MNKQSKKSKKKKRLDLSEIISKLRQKKNYIKTLKQIQKQLKNHYYVTYLLLGLIFGYNLIFTGAANNFAKGEDIVLVPRRASAQAIINILNTNGLLPGKFATKVAIKLTGNGSELHSGRFVVKRNSNLPQLFAALGENSDIKNYLSITIPEGYQISEILTLLETKDIVTKIEMEAYISSLNILELKNKHPFLSDNPLVGNKFLEGYLYPDTYYFSLYSEPQLVIETMLKTFGIKTKALLGNVSNIHEIVTLASIVEKEAVNPTEQKRIAGIFYNRLTKQMTLGSCPTVKYSLGRPHMKFLLYRHLEVKSPYNTYKNIGLPPGAICSPGVGAIQAAISPEQTNYLYFVANGDGTHQFSYSFQEHLRRQKAIGKIY